MLTEPKTMRYNHWRIILTTLGSHIASHNFVGERLAFSTEENLYIQNVFWYYMSLPVPSNDNELEQLGKFKVV